MPQGQPASDVGTFFGKYFLMKKLAAGGMGEIFLAKQQGPAGFQKILVVKKILAHLTENKEFIEAFLGEARLAAQMNHRNVVQVFELGEENGSYFIAMEYVAGKSLRDVIDMCIKKKEKMAPELARQVCEMICDGASYAHNLTDMTGRSLNLVHRDLNPQNVLISYTGDVKVIDFGIAKSEMSTVKTEAGMIKGKFVYMSPEQSLAKKLDKRSDIFAIGITLYEMLTGINPFHKNNIVLTLEAVQRYDPPPPSDSDPAYTPFDPIVAKALTKDRDRRYSDASEMMDDLRRIVLPRPPERLSQLMQRIFRQQVEEEQKMLMDSDQLRLSSSGPKKTPARPAHTPPKPSAVHQTQPDEPEGGTQMLPQAATRKPQVTPSKAAPSNRPPPRPPPPAAPPARKVPQGAGDTLIDMGGVAGGSGEAPPVDDEVPGGTAMLKPGQQLPPPPARKPPARPAPQPTADDSAPEGATAFLGTAPRREGSAPKRAPLPPATGSTNIMTQEESQAAQQEALAKMKEAENSVVKTRTRADKRGEIKQKKSSRGTWLMLGGGLLVALLLLGGLLYFLLQDDSGASTRRKKSTPTPVEQTQVAPTQQDTAPAPEEKKQAPAEEKPRPKKTQAPADDSDAQAAGDTAPAPAPAKAAPPPKKAASGKLLGTLTLNPGPNIPVAFGGNSPQKQVGAFNLPLTQDSGSIAVGDDNTMFKVKIDYQVQGGVAVLKVNSEPFSIVSVNGPSKGRTPVSDLKIDNKTATVVELRKPGADTAMTLRLLFKPNS